MKTLRAPLPFAVFIMAFTLPSWPMCVAQAIGGMLLFFIYLKRGIYK